MKLIMENWKKFLEEQQNWSFQRSAPVKSFQQYKDEDWEEKKKDMEAQVAPDDQVRYAAGKGKNDWIPELLNTIIPLFDVTGQVGEVDIESGKVTPQHKVFLKSVEDAKKQSGFFNTLVGAGIATLNGLAMVPVVGKAPKAFAKTAKAVNTSKTVSSKLRQATKESGLSSSQKMQISNLSKKIDTRVRYRTKIDALDRHLAKVDDATDSWFGVTDKAADKVVNATTPETLARARQEFDYALRKSPESAEYRKLMDKTPDITIATYTKPSKKGRLRPQEQEMLDIAKRWKAKKAQIRKPLEDLKKKIIEERGEIVAKLMGIEVDTAPAIARAKAMSKK